MGGKSFSKDIIPELVCADKDDMRLFHGYSFRYFIYALGRLQLCLSAYASSGCVRYWSKIRLRKRECR